MLKLEADNLDAIDEPLRSLYEEKDGKFRLKVEGIPDADGLKKKNNELLDELKGYKRAQKEKEDALAKEREELLAKSGDVEALRKSYDEKMTKITTDYSTREQNYQQQLQKLTVGQTATTLAAELAIPGSAPVLLPHIQARLSMEIRDGVPVTVVLGQDGKPSALTIDDLKSELTANQAFAPIIAASKAAGGGASGSGNGGGAAKKAVTRSQFDQMNAAQRMEHLKSGGTITS
jgi:hypothetical protein